MSDSYPIYAEKIDCLSKKLNGIDGFGLSYIKQNVATDATTEGLELISNKFFQKAAKRGNLLEEDIVEITEIVSSALLTYGNIRLDVENDTELTSPLKKFLLKKLHESIQKARMIQIAISFEAEKSYFSIHFFGNNGFSVVKKKSPHNVDVSTKKEMLKKIDGIQESLYGPRITNVSDEKNIVMSFCARTFDKKKKFLTKEEQSIFENFLMRFQDSIMPDYAIPMQKKLPDRSSVLIEDIMKIAQYTQEKFYPEMRQWTHKKLPGGSAFSVSLPLTTISYPDKETTEFNKIFIMLGHEIAGHALRGENTHKNGLQVAGGSYEDIEEGITKLNDNFLKYTLDTYPLVPNDLFIGVFIGENYNFKETYELLRIFKKMDGSSDTKVPDEKDIQEKSFSAAKRVKSYYPWDDVGSNRKDVIYFRGEKKIIEHLRGLSNDTERSNRFKKAMRAKVSFADIENVDALLAELGTQEVSSLENKLVDKIIAVKLQQGTGAFNKNYLSTVQN